MKVESQNTVWTDLTPEQIVEKEHELDSMKTMIESLSKIQHVEILRILKKNNSIKINENRNGVYINLSYVPKYTIDEISKYLQYVKAQEDNLEQFETKKEEFKQFLND